MLFNLIELAYNNTLQLQYKVTEGNVVENFRMVVSSEDDLTNAPQLVKDIAAEFPFTEFQNPDGPCSHVDFIRVLDGNRSAISYSMMHYVYKDQTEVVKRSVARPVVVGCLDDLSVHDEKVQRFAAIVFTDEVKAAEQARIDSQGD